MNIKCHSTLFLLLWLCLTFDFPLVRAETISRDAVGRILQVDHGDGTLTTYSYDASGNRLSRDRIDNRLTIAITVDPPNAGRVTGAGLVALNNEASLSASPTSGFIFHHWSEGGANLGTDSTLTFPVSASRNLVAHFVPAAAAIAVTDLTITSPTELTGGAATLSFVSQKVNSPITRTLVIRNGGGSTLTGLIMTLEGPGASAFTTPVLLDWIQPDGSIAFNVQFLPSSLAAQAATLHILSNDPSQPSFDIALVGTVDQSPERSSPGRLDWSLNPIIDGTVLTMAVQPDEKILLSGVLASISGQSSDRIARIRANGVVEFAQPTGAFDFFLVPGSSVSQIVVQDNNKIVFGGTFRIFTGETRDYVYLISGDDPSSAPILTLDGSISAMVPQPDGKMLIAESRASEADFPPLRMMRWTKNWTPDDPVSFRVCIGSHSFIRSIAPQADGKVLIVGGFDSIGDKPCYGIARLLSNGFLEDADTFDPGSGSMDGASSKVDEVQAIALQADGKILIGGAFTTFNGQSRNGFARLNADGSLDAGFLPQVGGSVTSVAIQADGKILISGTFDSVGGIPRHGVARLNASGDLDLEFDPNYGTSTGDIYGVALQADGKVLICGRLEAVNGMARRGLARLHNGHASQTLNVLDKNHVQWVRQGTTPEVDQVTFEVLRGF